MVKVFEVKNRSKAGEHRGSLLQERIPYEGILLDQ